MVIWKSIFYGEKMKRNRNIIILLLLVNVVLFAQNNSAEHLAHNNHFAIFAGNTHSIDPKSDDLTFGADYVRGITSWMGIGIYGEAILAEQTAWIIGATLNFNIVSGLGFRTGPGIEFASHIPHVEGSHEILPSETSSEILYRAGLYYAIDAGDLVITPSVDFDLVKDQKFIVYGINFGASF